MQRSCGALNLASEPLPRVPSTTRRRRQRQPSGGRARGRGGPGDGRAPHRARMLMGLSLSAAPSRNRKRKRTRTHFGLGLGRSAGKRQRKFEHVDADQMKTQNVKLACKRMASGAQQRSRDGAEHLPARAATAVPPQRPTRAHPPDARVTYMYARTYSKPKGCPVRRPVRC